MSTILSQSELRKWLRNKPDAWVQALVVRASLRAIPIIGLAHVAWFDEQALYPLRSILVSWAACNTQHALGPSSTARAAAALKAQYMPRFLDFASATASSFADPNFAAHATSAIKYAEDAAFTLGYDIIPSVIADAKWLERSHDPKSAVEALTLQPLWLNKAPEEFQMAMGRLRKLSESLDFTYQVWWAWIEGRIKGGKSFIQY